MIDELNHEAPLFRREAAEMLGELREVSAVDALKRALDDGNREVQHKAAEALVRIAILKALGAEEARDR